jgi:diguanylate cyclase (GGDEF)-like protein
MLPLRDPSLPDELTGLPTRRAFVARAGAVLADPAAAPVALILADIDDCKRFNGCHGHNAGDALIQQVARLCQAAARPVDLVARVAGETFALLAPRLPADQALALAEALRLSVAAAAVATPEGPRAARVSVGVAMAANADPEALLAAADAAVLAAKWAGKNCVRLAPAA